MLKVEILILSFFYKNLKSNAAMGLLRDKK